VGLGLDDARSDAQEAARADDTDSGRHLREQDESDDDGQHAQAEQDPVQQILQISKFVSRCRSAATVL
jgi:hypothetical protein